MCVSVHFLCRTHRHEALDRVVSTFPPRPLPPGGGAENLRLFFSKPDIKISGGSEKINWTDRRFFKTNFVLRMKQRIKHNLTQTHAHNLCVCVRAHRTELCEQNHGNGAKSANTKSY